MRALVLLLAATPLASAAELPLPKAPVRLIVPDVPAFDATLSGAFRNALSGKASEGDPVVAAWRRSRVGSKLETQWGKLAGDLPVTWEQIRALKPKRLGFALLDVGQLEAVLAVETPLTTLPFELASGTARTHGSASYHVVAPGAADASPDPERRMGLAWARTGGVLLLATSERALLLALDEKSGFRAPLDGLVGVDLDLDALRGDRYFRREFLFGTDATGHVRAALRLEKGELIEVREGGGAGAADGFSFDATGAAAAGWEPDAAGLFAALRAGLLEPVPSPPEHPVVALAPLPAAARLEPSDRYLVNLEKPVLPSGAPANEDGELPAWRELLVKHSVAGFGYSVGSDGSRQLTFQWPQAAQKDLEELLRTTLERRAGRAQIESLGDVREIRIGPALPALALKRTGTFVWIGESARALEGVAEPSPSPGVARWGHLDLSALRADSVRWARAEGPAAPETVRPFADRLLGLLGWMPGARTIDVERKRTEAGWSERVVFGSR
jgi:hypothetical protein